MSKIKIYDGVTINMSTSKVIKEGEVRYINSSDVSYCGSGGGVNQSVQQPIAAIQPTVGQGVSNRGGLNYGGPAVQPMPAISNMGPGSMGQPPMNIAPPAPGMGGGMQTLGPGSMGQPPMNIAPPAPGTYGPGSMQPMPAVQPPMNIAPPAPGMGGGYQTMGPGSSNPNIMGTSAATGTPQGGTNGK